MSDTRDKRSSPPALDDETLNNANYWVNKYCDTFDEGFPIWGMADRSEAGIIRAIKDSLAKGEPLRPPVLPGVDY